MDVIEVLMKSLEESQQYLEKALKGLTEEEISWTPKVNCNSIIFIFWHLVRVEDIWISRILQNRKEAYESEGWQGQLGTPAKESGFQYTAKQLQSWPMPKIELLNKYAASVRANTIKLLSSVTPEKLSEVVWPSHRYETVGAILSHLITEIALHVGQIDYLRGTMRGLQS